MFTTPPHPDISTNDGTHRLNIKWTISPEVVKEYETDKNKLNEAIHGLTPSMFPEDIGLMYRWESEDLILSKAASKMTPTEMRDYITPKVTILPIAR
jgi:hypothetical protein